MTWGVRGLIEGFYGTPWTWDDRLLVLRACAERGMTHYVYAPKDDPRHRERWREPYGPAALEGFSRLAAESGLDIGFGISPGLDIDPRDEGDLSALGAKVDSMVDLGVKLIVLALDDLPVDPRGGAARGVDHALLSTWLHEHLAGRASVALIPTDYVGTGPSPYLDAIAASLPDDVMVGWTGPFVVNDRITTAEAVQRAASLGGRPPLLWDNYPVNDGFMDDRLFMGPLRGRDADLGDACSGYLANAMVQPRSSMLPLASVAAYLAGVDAFEGWRAAAGDLRIFAEACDGSVPHDLVARLVQEIDTEDWYAAAVPLNAWLADAAICEAPGLGGEADEWLAQVRREARLALSTVRLLSSLKPSAVIGRNGAGQIVRPDPDAAAGEAFTLALKWPRVRRSAHTVLGSRCGFRPVIGQWPNGQWRFDPAALEEGRNATDLLVRSVFAALGSAPSPAESAGPVHVVADGVPVTVADDGTFTVAPTASVVVHMTGRRTALLVPTVHLGVAH